VGAQLKRHLYEISDARSARGYAKDCRRAQSSGVSSVPMGLVARHFGAEDFVADGQCLLDVGARDAAVRDEAHLVSRR
jgi:hypothetical protein